MRAVLTRVKSASVSIDGSVVGKIGKGFLILLGVGPEDTKETCRFLAEKALGLRVFEDGEGKMNLGLSEVAGQVMVVSQFTLHASTKKGNRPSYIKAAKPDISVPLYEKFCLELSIALGKSVKTGVFGADMQCSLINDGPVTIFMDSKNKE